MVAVSMGSLQHAHFAVVCSVVVIWCVVCFVLSTATVCCVAASAKRGSVVFYVFYVLGTRDNGQLGPLCIGSVAAASSVLWYWSTRRTR